MNQTKTPSPLLHAEKLRRAYRGVAVVRDISLSLYGGGVTGFLGLNGAGKTTTLRMLCGTLAPDSGSVSICGHDLYAEPQVARARLGFLPDTPPLYPELTVDEYLHYCARLRRLPVAEIDEACARVKAQTGLHDCGVRRSGNLSRGYQQRLGIAQAIIHQPDVIVLDEPTSGLDPRQIENIRVLVRNLGEHAAVLFSTHQLADARAVCDRVAIIHAGEIVHDANSDDTLAQTFFDITGVGGQ